MNLHMCAKCGANQPSRLVAFPECVLRLVRLFAAVCADSRKNTPKKQHLYIENYNSDPNMQTSTSLTFFTAISVAFSGALAKELLIFCRQVRTELYYIDVAFLSWGVGNNWLVYDVRYATKRYAPSSLEIE